MPKANKPKPEPRVRFVMLGKSKYVHVARTKALDLKLSTKGGSGCQQVRKFQVANTVPKKGISAEAALALNGCPSCGTEEVAKRHIPEADKRAARKDKRDEVMDRAKPKGKQMKGTALNKAMSLGGSKPKAATKTKAGTRSTAPSGVDNPTRYKAEQHAVFGRECGWDVTVEEDATAGYVVIGKRGKEITYTWFVDGKYDESRPGELHVGSWTGKLRGAHACRRQWSMEGRDRPHPEPGKGRSGPRAGKKTEEVVPEDESPEDAKRRVPFSVDDPDIEIIDALKGKVIRWRNTKANMIMEARVPSNSKRTSIGSSKSTGLRYICFMEVVEVDASGREQLGGERAVYINKIVRVVE